MSYLSENVLGKRWQQGILLRTRATNHYSQEQWEKGDVQEKRRIFCDFTAMDEGRSRTFIMECPDPDIAKAVVEAHNAYQDGCEVCAEE